MLTAYISALEIAKEETSNGADSTNTMIVSTLLSLSCLSSRSTYSPPSANVLMIMRFLAGETFRFQSTGMGRKRIMKSVTTLMTPAAMTTAVKLMHLPLMDVFHCEAGGTH